MTSDILLGFIIGFFVATVSFAAVVLWATREKDSE